MTELPPPDIVRAAYAELAVTDLAAARWFWVDMLGFVVTAEQGGALFLRGHDELTHHSLVLRSGALPGAAAIGYRVRTPADLDRAEHFFTERGCALERRPAGATPGIGETVRVQDPLGFTVDFFHATERAERLIQRYDLHRGAHIARLDHFNIVVPDIPAAYAHYESLGFGCSETIEDEHQMFAAWMYRKQTVHDVAFTAGSGPRLHHLGFATHESHHVLTTCDLFGATNNQHHIERGPGRHGVSNAFYVYLRDPDGHRIEVYTSDYFTGDPDHETYRWDVHDNRRRDYWGNAVIPSWYSEASPVLDLDGKVQPVVELAQTAEATVGADGFTAPAE